MGYYISGISLAYLRYLPGISQVYHWYISGISQVYHMHFSGIFWVISKENHRYTLDIPQVNLRHM